MRWHHYAGLVFGLFTFTWVASGCLSMDPWDWHSSTEPTAEQAAAVAGAPMQIDALTLDRLRAALAALARRLAAKVKTLELVQFRSEPYLVAYGAPDEASQHLAPRAGVGSSSRARRLRALRRRRPRRRRARRDAGGAAGRCRRSCSDTMPTTTTSTDRRRSRCCARASTMRLAPGSTSIPPPARSLARKTRRAGSTGGSTTAFTASTSPSCSAGPALRSAIVVILSLGGLLVALTSMTDGWRRVARHVRRLR